MQRAGELVWSFLVENGKLRRAEVESTFQWAVGGREEEKREGMVYWCSLFIGFDDNSMISVPVVRAQLQIRYIIN